MPRVFISYSHDSPEHKEWVLQISEQLRANGLECNIDRHVHGFPPEGWPLWMEKQIEQVDYVLLVCTPLYLQRFRGEDTEGGRGVTFEGLIITQTLYDAFNQNTKFIPVIPETGCIDHVPLTLKRYNTYPLPKEYDALYRVLTGQPEIIATPVGTIKYMPPKNFPSHPANPIRTNRLPTTRGEFFGRKQELKLLNDAFADDHTTIVQFIAPGGTGKTKLLQHWLDQHRDIPALIAWSFYSQGSSEDKQVSATPFFEHLFDKFNTDKRQFNSEEDKGEHLAELLMQQSCVLVLDGLEPLQHASKAMRGELKDRAIRVLLKTLAGQANNSRKTFCVITTRLVVPEISNRLSVKSHDLHNLELADGVELLKSFNVHGRTEHLEQAVIDYGYHALALYLLGNAISYWLDGDVQKRDTLAELLDEDESEGRYAFKVMQAYAHWLQDTPELKLLNILGLFDHPIEKAVLLVLQQQQIPELTAGQTERDLTRAMHSLKQDHHLLFEHPGQPDLLDCHPLIREYFGKCLQRNPTVWKQTHQRLYEYYSDLPEKQLPDTVAEMQPLFAAISHGCAAGLHQQAMGEVYWPRIKREGENYLCNKLGAFGDDLATLTHFFIQPWQQVATALTEDDQAVILSWAGFRLRALGRLIEAAQPMRAGFEISVKQENWKGAAQDANNLSELWVTLGDLTQARHYGSLSVDYADQFGDLFYRMAVRTTLADAMLKSGELQQALALFQEAKKMQQERQPEYPTLYSFPGFCYCDLLLAQGEAKAVLLQAEQTLAWAKQATVSLLSITLDQLSLAKAHGLLAVQASVSRSLQKNYSCKATGHVRKAGEFLEQAVTGLRAAGAQHHIPSGLLARAAWFRFCEDFKAAHKDLNEVLELAESYKMRLHLCDYHLEAARLALAELDLVTAKGHCDKAEQLIKDTGYNRRLPELQILQQALA
ncbi:MAG TPA: SEFIR domain-containing protein [Methylobacter sp.]|jgi:tetratricopeptide (TPR) repeat protein